MCVGLVIRVKVKYYVKYNPTTHVSCENSGLGMSYEPTV